MGRRPDEKDFELKLKRVHKNGDNLKANGEIEDWNNCLRCLAKRHLVAPFNLATSDTS